MPEGLEGGVVVHDGFKSYAKLGTAAQPPVHALCNAHHLRELKALIEFDKETWAQAMTDCLRDACKAVAEARANGKTALSPAALEAFHARYWEALRQGLAWHRSLPRLEKGAPKAAARSAGPETICCFACTDLKTTRCASWWTSKFPSPTIWPNRRSG